MGGFLVLFVSILIMLMVSLAPSDHDASQSSFVGGRPSLQSVAANMIEMHQAAVDFVSQSENRNPVGSVWSFTYADQSEVRCSGGYAGGAYDSNGIATTPVCTSGSETDFRIPAFYSGVYNWGVYYVSDGAGGSDDILITYVQASSDSVGGFTPAEIATGLGDYDLASETDWYWGLTPSSGSPLTLDDGMTTINLPVAFSITDTVAIATIIP